MNKIDCAIVLAGGKGARLRPMTFSKPKPLVPVALTPMIDFALKQVIDAGINKVLIAVRFLGEQIREYLENNDKYKNLEIIIPNIDPVGTADAVRLLSDFIEGDFIVSMADIVSNFQLKHMIDFFYKTGAYSRNCGRISNAGRIYYGR